jgi:hypothetical protein
MGLEAPGLLRVFGDVRLQKRYERGKAGFAGFVCSCFTHWHTLGMWADTHAHQFKLGCLGIFKRLRYQRKVPEPLRNL